MKGVKPTSYTDALAMKHDIEYLSLGEKHESDYQAYSSASLFNPQGFLMNLGLRSRSYIDRFAHLFGSSFHMNGRTDQLKISTNELQQLLLNKVKPELAKYGISNRLASN
jgi:hypothetical protein